MTQFKKRVIRCAVDITKRDPFKDVNTGETPWTWNGVGTELQFAFFVGSGANATLADIFQVETLYAAITAADRTGGFFANKLAEVFDPDLTLEEWQAGVSARPGFERAAHAIFEFLGQDLDFSLDSGTQKDFWLVLYGDTADDPTDPDTFAGSTFTVIEDGVQSPDAPVQANNVIPFGATYDGIGHYTLTVTQNAAYLWTKAAHDTDVVNGAETVTVSNSVFFAQGTTVQLRGTANTTVTAVMRTGNVFLTADQIAAHYVPITYPNLAKFALKETGGSLYHDVTLVQVDGIWTFDINQTGYTP